MNEVISHNRITFDEKEEIAVASVIKSGYWAGGEVVEALEEELKHITDRAFAIAVSSGLAALRIALIVLGVSKGDEVIVPAYSCVALANAVLSVEGIPVPVDIRDQDFNIDTDAVERSLTNKTKAIIVVHTFGSIANINALKKFGIPLVEDCAHTLGIAVPGGKVGNMGDITICSFYAMKLLGGGEGGAILTNNGSFAEIANDYRDYTDKEPSGRRLNDKLSNIHAAVSLTQLRKLPDFIIKRKEIADRYFELLKNLKAVYPFILLPLQDTNRIWYRFPLLINGINTNAIINKMEVRGVAIRRPIELWISDYEKYPNTKNVFEHLISLPLYPDLSASSQKRVVKALEQSISEFQ